jgi:hypothetical protein
MINQGGYMLTLLLAHKAIVLGALLAISECLAIMPAIRANSIFQLGVYLMKALRERYR